jgi:hypothetical protein
MTGMKIMLDIAPGTQGRNAHLQKLYPTFEQAVDFGGRRTMPSASLIHSKCRQLNRAIKSCVEINLFGNGLPQKPGMRKVLSSLLRELPASGPGAEYISNAILIYQSKPPGTMSSSLPSQFVSDLKSRPAYGSYDWSPGHRKIYALRCFLAINLRKPGLSAIASEIRKALMTNKILLKQYTDIVNVLKQLETPLLSQTLEQEPSNDQLVVTFLPPISTPEALAVQIAKAGAKADFATKLLLSRQNKIRSSFPDMGTNGFLAEQLMQNLYPDHDSLRLRSSARYKFRYFDSISFRKTSHQVSLIKFLAARQSRQKSLIKTKTEASPFRVEPAPVFYLAAAASYGHLKKLLAEIFDSELEDTCGMRETWSYGQIKERKLSERGDDLGSEVDYFKSLLLGLHIISCQDLKIYPDTIFLKPNQVENCQEAALNWLESFSRDPDLLPDVRICIPVSSSNQNTALWSVAGVRLIEVSSGPGRPPHLVPIEALLPFSIKSGTLSPVEFRELLNALETRSAFSEKLIREPTRNELLKLLKPAQD